MDIKNFDEYFLDIHPDTPIYRIIKYKHLLELLKTRQLVISSPRKWDDPYENIYLKAEKYMLIVDDENVLTHVKGINSKVMEESIYGQCWSLMPESDALWRIYSDPEKEIAVKIKTTAQKLYGEIDKNKEKNEFKGIPYIGKVHYISEGLIADFIQEKYRETHNTQHGLILNPLLSKREEFSHEAEVRLLYNLTFEDIINEPKELFSNQHDFPNHISLSINPDKMIEEIVFDPRISDDIFDKCREELNACCKINAYKSSLYNAPLLKFEMVYKQSYNEKGEPQLKLLH